jgi:hypothetical protein
MIKIPFRFHSNSSESDYEDAMLFLPHVCSLQILTTYAMESLRIVIGGEVVPFEPNVPQVVCIYRTSSLKCFLQGESVQAKGGITIIHTIPPIMANCGWQSVRMRFAKKDEMLTEAQLLDRDFSIGSKPKRKKKSRYCSIFRS